MDLLWAAETAGTASGGGYWKLAMVLAGIGFLGFFARWRKRRTPPTPSVKELRQREEEPNRYRDAADRAIVELLETSRALNAQVDTKIRVLNRLVKDAEVQTKRLEELLRLAGAVTSPDAAGKTPAAVESTRTKAAEQPSPPSGRFRSELHERVILLKNEGKSLAEIAKATSLSTTEVKFALESLGQQSQGTA